MTHVIVVGSADRRIEELLRAPGIEVSSAAGSDLNALAAPSGMPPRVIAIDLQGRMTLPPEVALLRKAHPDTGVVLIASTLDSTLLLEAMRAGVTEVVAEPVNAAELRAAVVRLAGDSRPAQAGHVYGFIGAKGGVGTTTVAVNVAAALGSAARGARTLLVDLHLAGGDAATFTGVEPRFSVADAVDNMHRLDAVFLDSLVVETAPNTDLLAAPERRPASSMDPERVRHVLSFASTNYRYTVVDLPRDQHVLDMLDGFTRIYIVANQELTTIKSASRLAASLRERCAREKLAIVLSRSDRQADIGHADVEKAVGLPVVHTFPSDYRLALQALNTGRPVVLDNHNDLSASFRKFVHRAAGLRTDREPARSSGLFGRLTQSRA